MADLDDFFAKKDKKKKKGGKKKTAVPAVLTKPDQIGEEDIVEEKVPVVKPKKAKGRIAEYNDDSWNDEMPDATKEVDFSGLQIGEMKQVEEVDTAESPDADTGNGTNDTTTATNNNADGGANGNNNNNEEDEEEDTQDPVEVALAQSGVYRPPGQRNAGGPSQDWKYKKKESQAPPDMSEMAFPSLADAVDDSKQTKRDTEGFQRVGPGGRTGGAPGGGGGGGGGVGNSANVDSTGRYIPMSQRGAGGGGDRYQPPQRRAGW